ncbi:unnamed protein product, partial [Ectocarpus sp. 6 AP-2014]
EQQSGSAPTGLQYSGRSPPKFALVCCARNDRHPEEPNDASCSCPSSRFGRTRAGSELLRRVRSQSKPPRDHPHPPPGQRDGHRG